MGFILNRPSDLIAWWMYCAYTKGISPKEFKKCKISDIKVIMGIDSAINEKNMREAQIRKLMSQVK